MIAAAGRAFRARPRAPLLLVLPALAVVAGILLPVVYLVIRASAADRDAWQVLDPDVTGRLVLDTAVLVGAVVAAAVSIGVPLAWLVVRTDLPGRRIWGVAAALPLVIPSYVAALALLGALGPRGLLQDLLEEPFGVERLPEIYGFPGAVLALTLSTYPYVFLLTAAALRTLDPAVEEAARGLGRSPLGAFWRATVPRLRPSIAAGSLLVALYVLSDFGAVSLMQYPALTRAVYLQYEALFDREPAAVLALVLVFLAVLVLLAESYAGRRARTIGGRSGAARAQLPVALGRWRGPALAFCASTVGVFLLLPVGVLLYWTGPGAPPGHELVVPWRELGNTLLAAGLAAGVCIAAVMPVALLSQRHPRRWTRLLERVSYTGNALPGIVIALSLVFFGARYGGVLYQTLGLLVFAYFVRFAPQALAAVGATLRGIDPAFEEAARGLGKRPSTAFVRVTLPLLRPGVLAGAALVFLSVMKELPATLLLRPIGFDTLATEVWTHTSAAAYSDAAVPALLLIAASVPIVYPLIARRPADIGQG